MPDYVAEKSDYNLIKSDIIWHFSTGYLRSLSNSTSKAEYTACEAYEATKYLLQLISQLETIDISFF